MMTSFDHDSRKKQGVRFWQKTEHNPFPVFHGNVKRKEEDDDGDDYEDDHGYEDEDG